MILKYNLKSVIFSDFSSIGFSEIVFVSSFVSKISSISSIDTISVGAEEIVSSKFSSFNEFATLFHCLLASESISTFTVAILDL